ncbi:MAG TPA: hypothetical protein ENF97_00780, partial [Candidatus Omnitrophica bacterium]|nr:hypothetical protein [Candidatus Omnitrophota bacterium]
MRRDLEVIATSAQVQQEIVQNEDLFEQFIPILEKLSQITPPPSDTTQDLGGCDSSPQAFSQQSSTTDPFAEMREKAFSILEALRQAHREEIERRVTALMEEISKVRNPLKLAKFIEEMEGTLRDTTPEEFQSLDRERILKGLKNKFGELKDGSGEGPLAEAYKTLLAMIPQADGISDPQVFVSTLLSMKEELIKIANTPVVSTQQSTIAEDAVEMVASTIENGKKFVDTQSQKVVEEIVETVADVCEDAGMNFNAEGRNTLARVLEVVVESYPDSDTGRKALAELLGLAKKARTPAEIVPVWRRLQGLIEHINIDPDLRASLREEIPQIESTVAKLETAAVESGDASVVRRLGEKPEGKNFKEAEVLKGFSVLTTLVEQGASEETISNVGSNVLRNFYYLGNGVHDRKYSAFKIAETLGRYIENLDKETRAEVMRALGISAAQVLNEIATQDPDYLPQAIEVTRAVAGVLQEEDRMVFAQALYAGLVNVDGSRVSSVPDWGRYLIPGNEKEAFQETMRLLRIRSRGVETEINSPSQERHTPVLGIGASSIRGDYFSYQVGIRGNHLSDSSNSSGGNFYSAGSANNGMQREVGYSGVGLTYAEEEFNPPDSPDPLSENFYSPGSGPENDGMQREGSSGRYYASVLSLGEYLSGNDLRALISAYPSLYGASVSSATVVKVGDYLVERGYLRQEEFARIRQRGLTADEVRLALLEIGKARGLRVSDICA